MRLINGIRITYVKARNQIHLYNREERKLLAYKDRENRKICVVVGNGPSLKAEDLEWLREKKIPCFASNKIYKIFDQTSWRPDYYACVDDKVFQQNYIDIMEKITCPIFLSNRFIGKAPGIVRKNEGTNIIYINYFTNRGRMSFYRNPAIFISGGSVTFVLIQLAWMMGFREIYLLGCDNSYYRQGNDAPGTVLGANDVGQGYFCENYLKQDEVMVLGDLGKCERGYNIAKKYVQEHGGGIYNATRGGKLEVFQRIKLEDILKG